MSSPNPMIETLKDFVQRVEGLGIPYMVTGSFAILAYATARLTYDIDAIIEISDQEWKIRTEKLGRFNSGYG